MPFSRRRTPLGSRRNHVRFEKKQTSDDGLGGQVTSWKTSGHSFARVTALDERSRESLSALQIQGRAAYHFDIPYRQDLVDVESLPTDWRVVWGRKTLEIQQAVDDEARKRRLVLLVTEAQ